MTLAAKARLTLSQSGLGRTRADEVVATVIDTLDNPDAEMIDAGVAELNEALGKPGKNDRAYRKQLAVTIYRAMLGRARR